MPARMPVLLRNGMFEASKPVDWRNEFVALVNFELPEVAEAYVHRIGRTARAGAAGIAISLCDGAGRALLRNIEKLTRLQLPMLDRRGAPPTAPRRAETPVRPAAQSRRPDKSEHYQSRETRPAQGQRPRRAPMG